MGLLGKEHDKGDLAGFVLICWNGDGGYDCDIHVPEGSGKTLNVIKSFSQSCISREIARIDREYD